MAKKRRSVFWCAAVAALAAFLAAAPALADSGTQAGPRAVEAWARLPLHFIENQGQVSHPVRLYVHGPGHALFFTPEGLTLVVSDTAGRPSAVVRLTPLGMSRNAALTGQDPQPGRVNYLLGRDPRNWRTDLPTYKAALYRGAYPGIDLKFYGRGGELEYDLIVQPGATPDRAKFRVTGIRGLRLTPAGHLEMQLPGGGTLLQKKPVIYQEVAGRRLPREGRFTVRPDDSGFVYGFEVAAHDPRHPLVIDPVIVFSSFLGGTNAETGAAIAVRTIVGITNAYVTGQTSSFNFPQTAPKSIPGTNAFITKFSQNGNSLVFSTILGGSGTDVGTGIGVDNEGRAVVVGYTNSQDFPLRNAAQSRNRGGNDAFVTKLSASGNSLVFSTFLGGSGDDKANAVAVHPNTNDAFVTGTTTSNDFRVRRALQGVKPGPPGTSNAFVARFRPGGGLNFSTYLGGRGEDSGNGIAASREAGPNDFVFVTGTTNSEDFPTRNAFQPILQGATDAFVTKLTDRGRLPNDGTPVFSTFLGGRQEDAGRAIAVHVDALDQGFAFVTGDTTSIDFPTRNPFQGGKQDGKDAFVTQFDPSGENLVFSTYLGGRGDDQGLGIAVHGPAASLGRATVTGVTSSFNFPTRDVLAGQNTLKGDTDAFVTRFQENGDNLTFSTFLGGTDNDRGQGVAVDGPTQDTFVIGTTSSFNFPTRSPIQPTGADIQGGTDAFVTRIRQ